MATYQATPSKLTKSESFRSEYLNQQNSINNNTSFKLSTDLSEKYYDQHNKTNKLFLWLNNIYFIAPSVFILTVDFSIILYMYIEKWDFITSFFYSTTTFFGCLYGVPEEQLESTKYLTLFLYIWGTLLLYGSIGAFASVVVESVIRNERKKAKVFLPYDFDGDGKIGAYDVFYFQFQRLLDYIAWSDNKQKYFVIFCSILWVLIGMIYCRCYQNWSWIDSLYFSIGSISSAGSPSPECIPTILSSSLSSSSSSSFTISISSKLGLGIGRTSENSLSRFLFQLNSAGTDDSIPNISDTSIPCHIDPIHGLFITFYVLIGVPLFALLLGQFSLLLIERAVRRKEFLSMQQPLTEDEFIFATSLCQDSQYTSSYDKRQQQYEFTQDIYHTSPTATATTTATTANTSPTINTTTNTNANSSSNMRRSNDEQYSVGLTTIDEDQPLSINTTTTANNNANRNNDNINCNTLPIKQTPMCHNSINDVRINLAQFIVMEMLRLKRIDQEDISEISYIFQLIDFDNTGVIDRYKLQRLHLISEVEKGGVDGNMKQPFEWPDIMSLEERDRAYSTEQPVTVSNGDYVDNYDNSRMSDSGQINENSTTINVNDNKIGSHVKDLMTKNNDVISNIISPSTTTSPTTPRRNIHRSISTSPSTHTPTNVSPRQQLNPTVRSPSVHDQSAIYNNINTSENTGVGQKISTPSTTTFTDDFNMAMADLRMSARNMRTYQMHRANTQPYRYIGASSPPLSKTSSKSSSHIEDNTVSRYDSMRLSTKSESNLTSNVTENSPLTRSSIIYSTNNVSMNKDNINKNTSGRYRSFGLYASKSAKS